MKYGEMKRKKKSVLKIRMKYFARRQVSFEIKCFYN